MKYVCLIMGTLLLMLGAEVGKDGHDISLQIALTGLSIFLFISWAIFEIKKVK